jgi:hypothetical protein
MRYQPRNSTEHEPSDADAALTVALIVTVIGCLAAFLWSGSATELCRMVVLLVR